MTLVLEPGGLMRIEIEVVSAKNTTSQINIVCMFSSEEKSAYVCCCCSTHDKKWDFCVSDLLQHAKISVICKT